MIVAEADTHHSIFLDENGLVDVPPAVETDGNGYQRRIWEEEGEDGECSRVEGEGGPQRRRLSSLSHEIRHDEMGVDESSSSARRLGGRGGSNDRWEVSDEIIAKQKF